MARSSFPTAQVIRIGITVVLLIAVLIMKQRCGKAAIEMFRALDTPGAPRSDGGAPARADASAPRALTPVDATH